MLEYKVIIINIMNKKEIIQAIIKLLEEEITDATNAAEQAHLAATDDQSIAETQYDTLAIESAYLAEGQSKRIATLKNSLQIMHKFANNQLTSTNKVNIGSLVQTNEIAKNTWLFITPTCGGYHTTFKGSKITLVSANSPLGKALIGAMVDDEITYQVGNSTIEKTVTTIL